MLRKICWFVVCVTCMSVQGYDYTKASKKGSQNVPRSEVYITFCVLSSLIVIHHTEHILRNTFCYFFIYQLPGILHNHHGMQEVSHMTALPPHAPLSRKQSWQLLIELDALWSSVYLWFKQRCLLASLHICIYVSMFKHLECVMSADSLTVSFPLVFRVVLSLERAVYLPAIRASALWRNRVSFFRLHWHQLQFYHSLTSFKCSKFFQLESTQ